MSNGCNWLAVGSTRNDVYIHIWSSLQTQNVLVGLTRLLRGFHLMAGKLSIVTSIPPEAPVWQGWESAVDELRNRLSVLGFQYIFAIDQGRMFKDAQTNYNLG